MAAIAKPAATIFPDGDWGVCGLVLVASTSCKRKKYRNSISFSRRQSDTSLGGEYLR